MVNCSVFVMCEPIPSLSASASASAAVTTSLSEQVEATLLATIAMILHTTLLYLWDIVIQKQIKATFVVGLCDLHFVPRVRRGSYKKKGQHEFAIHLNFRICILCTITETVSN